MTRWLQCGAAALVTVGLLAMAASAHGGEFNAVLSVGDAAPAFETLPGVDGRQHALADSADKKLALVVFTCNSCPYAVDYEDRLNALAAKYAESLYVAAINSNLGEADRLPAMQARATAKKFVFPYLFDETQQIAKQYGAIRTPQFFLLDAKRRVLYMGALDDNSDPKLAQKNYLADAIEAALTGAEIEPAETPPVGCNIRWDRRRGR